MDDTRNIVTLLRLPILRLYLWEQLHFPIENRFGISSCNNL